MLAAHPSTRRSDDRGSASLTQPRRAPPPAAPPARSAPTPAGVEDRGLVYQAEGGTTSLTDAIRNVFLRPQPDGEAKVGGRLRGAGPGKAGQPQRGRSARLQSLARAAAAVTCCPPSHVTSLPSLPTRWCTAWPCLSRTARSRTSSARWVGTGAGLQGCCCCLALGRVLRCLQARRAAGRTLLASMLS